MEFTDNPLEPTVSDRGLAYMQPIDSGRGTVAVHDSSNAEREELWLQFTPVEPQSTLDGAYSVPMGIEDALTFACQIIALGARRGYRLNGPAAEAARHLLDHDDEQDADADALEALAANLHDASAQLAAALPDRPDPGLRSDRDAITELAPYLATVHTAAALAEDIPRLIGEIDITAYTADIGAHLGAAAEAAVARIRTIALAADDEVVAGAFPPAAYRLNSAGDYLTGLRGRALALAAHAETVRAEIDCYLEPESE